MHDTIDESMVTTTDIKRLKAAILGATQAVIEAEPRITEHDTILGDGDCGQTLKTAALAVQESLFRYPLTSAPKTMSSIADTIEHAVGGTSSAIYCIFLNAFASGLLKHDACWVVAARHALETLMTYTKARVDDRTLMDTLCPFIETLDSGLEEAREAARQGSIRTCHLFATLGRASYLSDELVLASGVPDTGAYGLAELLTSLVNSLVTRE